MKLPLAAAPQVTPQMSGIQVTGFISCRRIRHLEVVEEASLMPSSWRTEEESEDESDAVSGSDDGMAVGSVVDDGSSNITGARFTRGRRIHDGREVRKERG